MFGLHWFYESSRALDRKLLYCAYTRKSPHVNFTCNKREFHVVFTWFFSGNFYVNWALKVKFKWNFSCKFHVKPKPCVIKIRYLRVQFKYLFIFFFKHSVLFLIFHVFLTLKIKELQNKYTFSSLSIYNFWIIIDNYVSDNNVHTTNWETNQKAYINLTQLNRMFKYNIIMPKHKNEKGEKVEKARIEYETLKWLVDKKEL